MMCLQSVRRAHGYSGCWVGGVVVWRLGRKKSCFLNGAIIRLYLYSDITMPMHITPMPFTYTRAVDPGMRIRVRTRLHHHMPWALAPDLGARAFTPRRARALTRDVAQRGLQRTLAGGGARRVVLGGTGGGRPQPLNPAWGSFGLALGGGWDAGCDPFSPSVAVGPPGEKRSSRSSPSPRRVCCASPHSAGGRGFST